MALRGGPEPRDPSPGGSLGRAFSAGANVLQRAGSATAGSGSGINKSGRRPGPNDARAPQRPAGVPTPQMAPGQVCLSCLRFTTASPFAAYAELPLRGLCALAGEHEDSLITAFRVHIKSASLSTHLQESKLLLPTLDCELLGGDAPRRCAPVQRSFDTWSLIVYALLTLPLQLACSRRQRHAPRRSSWSCRASTRSFCRRTSPSTCRLEPYSRWVGNMPMGRVVCTAGLKAGLSPVHDPSLCPDTHGKAVVDY